MLAILSANYRAALAAAILDPTALDDWPLNDDDHQVRIGLFGNDLAITPALAIAAFVVPTYTGYAAQMVVGTTVRQFTDPTTKDIVTLLGLGLAYQPTNNTGLPQPAYGYFIANEGGTDWYWAARFDQVYNFQDSSNLLQVEPQLRQLLNGYA